MIRLAAHFSVQAHAHRALASSSLVVDSDDRAVLSEAMLCVGQSQTAGMT